jgi:hypothetical protein
MAPWFRWLLTWGRNSPLTKTANVRPADDTQRRQGQIVITRYWYHSQLLKRRRSLSEISPGFRDQAQSDFFAKLPTEVRLRIYEYVVKDRNLPHISRPRYHTPDRISMAKTCTAEPIETEWGNKNDYSHIQCIEGGSYVKAVFDYPWISPLPFLQTCHRMFSTPLLRLLRHLANKL